MPFPRSTRRRLWIPGLVALLLAAALALDASLDAYGVPTGSMEPLLHGDRSTGDRVLVRRVAGLGPSLRRFDLAVFRSPDGVHCVKRLCGLPNESLQILDGDLYVRGVLYRKDERERAGVRVPLFDPDRSSIEAFWGPADGAWEREGGGWILDARKEGLVLLRNREAIKDDYLDPDGRRVAGRSEVRDLTLEADWTPLAEGGEFRIELSGGGGRFVFSLERRPDRCLARVARPGRAGEEVLSRGETAPVPAGVRVRLEAVNVDRRLSFLVEGRPAVPAVDYEGSSAGPSSGAAVGAVADGDGTGAGAALGGAGLRARLDRVRLLRDLHYTDRGRFGIRRPVELGPDQFFFLGDNSGESLDCREWGPVEGGALLGRPVLILWPPRRIRWL
ncbi:MAG TPA: S26 family signal peptidase [Planctomycetota bacterium]|nr:S26 family signal peptidase [Planctomycetota bacterium]